VLRGPASDGAVAVHHAGMSTTTSIGRGPASGGNENHDGDPTHTTLGETVGQEKPAGSEAVSGAPEVPAGVPGAKPKPDKPG
jgi:hypothetical protein